MTAEKKTEFKPLDIPDLKDYIDPLKRFNQ
jgi:hypothetical protein